MKTVLVTGGAGFIGSHACKALAAAGVRPVAFDNLYRGHRDAVKFGPFVGGDICDPAALDHAFRTYAPDAVMHFAALAYVGESVREPATYYRNNVVGTWTLIEAMLRAGCRKFVLSSSCATYGHAIEVPIRETHPQAPINPYGFTKLAGEHMLADLAATGALDFIALRYFNASGCDPEGDIGERHDPETHVIPLILQAAADPARTFSIFGTDYDTPDGTCIRDYVHVCDLASAHVLAFDRVLSTSGAAVFNLSYGKGASVRELVSTAERVTGQSIAVREEPRRPGDPAVLVGDPTRARSLLDWTPQYPDIETHIAHAWAFNQKR